LKKKSGEQNSESKKSSSELPLFLYEKNHYGFLFQNVLLGVRLHHRRPKNSARSRQSRERF